MSDDAERKSPQAQNALTARPSGMQWLTLKEASEFLGVHFTTLRKWADEGEIRVFRTPGGHRRFSLADLRRFLEERVRHEVTPDSEAVLSVAVDRRWDGSPDNGAIGNVMGRN